MTIQDHFLQPSLRRPRFMVGLWLALFLVFLAALVVRFTGPLPLIDNSVGIWFLKDDPNLAVYEQNNASFGNKEWSLMLLETGSVAEQPYLARPTGLEIRVDAMDATAVESRDSAPDGGVPDHDGTHTEGGQDPLDFLGAGVRASLLLARDQTTVPDR